MPAALIAKQLGASVVWNSAAQTIEIYSKGTTVPTPTTPTTPSTSNAKDAVKFYEAGTAASKMFEDNKAAAAYFISLYGKALQTGDTTAVETWIKNNIQQDSSGYSSSEFSIRDIQETVKGLHDRYGVDAITPIAKDVVAKADKQQLSADSEYEEYTYSRDLMYYVDAVGGEFEDRFGVYFIYNLDQKTNKLFFKQVVVY